MIEKISLKEKWYHFFNIILDPWIIILIVLTFFFILSSNFITQEPQKTIFSIILSLISGILGGVFAKKWSDIFEGKLIITRGISAIRSLKLLLLNISAIENRVFIYIKQLDKETINHEMIKTNFEEIIEKCNILEEEGLNAIENWTDIIPEANIKTQIGIISDLKKNGCELMLQIENLNKELKKNKELNEKEKKELTTEIRKKTEDLKKLNKQLNHKETDLFPFGLGGITGSSRLSNLNIGTNIINSDFATYGIEYQPVNSSGFFQSRKCKNCDGTFFVYDKNDINDLCNKCRSPWISKSS